VFWSVIVWRLWCETGRLDTQVLPFDLHTHNNRHQAAVVAPRELTVDLYLTQQTVVDHHLCQVHAEVARHGGGWFCYIYNSLTIELTRLYTPRTTVVVPDCILQDLHRVLPPCSGGVQVSEVLDLHDELQ
jgi:hypothetical protein